MPNIKITIDYFKKSINILKHIPFLKVSVYIFFVENLQIQYNNKECNMANELV